MQEKIFTNEKEKERAEKELIQSVKEDFKKRQKERLLIERQWELNLKFLSGDQYCDINYRGDIIDEDKTFFWQSKNAYNHIAPIIETRLAKFNRVRPVISVRPKSDDDKDSASAKKAEKLLEEAFSKCDMNNVVRRVTAWSETCGTGFYKIFWNGSAGNKIGETDDKSLYEGEVEICAVSPFEIFPDSLSTEKIDGLKSIIHAKAVDVSEIKRKYGVTVEGEDINIYSLTSMNKSIGKLEIESVKNSAVVIEKYERPSEEFPNGRMITVAGEKLLYCGELPYLNGKNGQRIFPFVKQESCVLPGSFFGKSIIERLIPVQRAFNAVKNRKHEFLNRLSLGVLTVEDGSIDVADLEDDGLEPGKVLVYRQGSTPPEMMEKTDMPSSFNEEEEKLLNEFVIISGVSDVVSSSENSKVSSGTALEILVEQDNERLTMVAERIREAYLKVASQALKLYATYVLGVKLVRSKNSIGKTKVYYVDKESISSDDVYLASENELRYSEAQKKEMILKLYESGLLFDKNDRLKPQVKEKVLELLGYNDLGGEKGFSILQEEKAVEENKRLIEKELPIEIIDDHDIHISEHKRYVLSEYNNLTEKQKSRFFAHILEHENKLNIQ